MSVPRSHVLVLVLVAMSLAIGACTSSESQSANADGKASSRVTAGETSNESEAETDQGSDRHQDPDQHRASEAGVVELTAEAASRVEIRIAVVEERVLAPQLETTGQVDFDQTRLAHVSPRISGRVHRVDAVLGQDVRVGQKLAEIDSIELGQAKAVYLQARAKEELARRSFDRVQGLFQDRIAAEQEVFAAEAELKEATAALHTAGETLHLYGQSETQVETLAYDNQAASIYPLRAPFAGTIVERHATLGELVTPDRNLFTLADLSRVWIWIDVYQRDLGSVHIGDGARARVDAFPDQAFTGAVSFLSARVDVETRTVRARLDVANHEGRLRPGMFVDVQLVDPHALEGGRPRASSLVVPESALVRDGDAFSVFVGIGERRFARREIRVGRRSGGDVEILEGLEPGISVVVEGAFLLKSALAKESLAGGHEH